jgi:hypothetical protein
MVVLVVTMVMVMCDGDGCIDGAASQEEIRIIRLIRADNSTFSGVTRCYSGGTVVLQWWYSGGTVVVQWWYSGVTGVSQWCYGDVTVVLVTWPSMVGHNSAATVQQQCNNSATGVQQHSDNSITPV